MVRKKKSTGSGKTEMVGFDYPTKLTKDTRDLLTWQLKQQDCFQGYNQKGKAANPAICS